MEKYPCVILKNNLKGNPCDNNSMSHDKRKRVELKGGLEHTSSSVEIKDDGSLVVEFYDFSDEAHNALGNDVAYLLTVQACDKDKVLWHLLEGQDLSAISDQDELLLALMEERFNSYFDVQNWFQTEDIPHLKSFDEWA